MMYVGGWEWAVFMKTMRRVRIERLAAVAGAIYVDIDEVMGVLWCMERGEGIPVSDEEMRKVWGE